MDSLRYKEKAGGGREEVSDIKLIPSGLSDLGLNMSTPLHLRQFNLLWISKCVKKKGGEEADNIENIRFYDN